MARIEKHMEKMSETLTQLRLPMQETVLREKWIEDNVKESIELGKHIDANVQKVLGFVSAK